MFERLLIPFTGRFQLNNSVREIALLLYIPSTGSIYAFSLALVVFYVENHSEEMAFKIVKVSVTFMLFVMSNLAVYCTAEENKTTDQEWYHKVCLRHMRRRVSQNKCSDEL